MEPSEPQPHVSVVIPARNAASTLGAQLDALAAQAPAALAEVIVVDNGSSDATAEMVEAWMRRAPYVRLVRCEQVGVNPARNAGTRAARADLVVICDADDVAGDGWIDAMTRALAADPLVGGALEPTLLNSEFVQDVRFNRRGHHVPNLPTNFGKHYAFGGNMGFRREVFDAVQGFDDAFPHAGADEIDFCWRAQAAGYTLGFAPDAVMHVRWRTDLRSLMRQSFKLASGTAYLHRKMIASGAVPAQSRRVQLAMFKAYWRRLRGVGRLTERAARWRLALRLSWIAGSLASAPRTRVLV
jgi:cellulose synthase/poly-beta-1,6-N-acetylglucosamine synthase-like glycosyltransferase